MTICLFAGLVALVALFRHVELNGVSPLWNRFLALCTYLSEKGERFAIFSPNGSLAFGDTTFNPPPTYLPFASVAHVPHVKSDLEESAERLAAILALEQQLDRLLAVLSERQARPTTRAVAPLDILDVDVSATLHRLPAVELPEIQDNDILIVATEQPTSPLSLTAVYYAYCGIDERIEQANGMPWNEFRKFAKGEGVSVKGGKKDILERLRAKWEGELEANAERLAS